MMGNMTLNYHALDHISATVVCVTMHTGVARTNTTVILQNLF